MKLKELKAKLKAQGDLFSERKIPDKIRGKKGLPASAVTEVSCPPHGDGKERTEWYFDADGSLVAQSRVRG